MRASVFGIFLILFAILGGSPGALGKNPGSGLAGSDHDFSGIPVGGGAVTGLCTFCHTPHQALESTLNQNHTLSNLTFRWCGQTETRYGTPLPVIPPDYRGPSKICLGCHSRSVTVGDIGWFDGRAWTGGLTLDTKMKGGAARSDGCMDHPHNNHPLALPYPYQGQASTYNGVTNGNAATGNFEPDPTIFGLRLFREQPGRGIEAGPVIGQTGIECSTCHDPHNGPSVGGGEFLRGSGNLCRKCHKDE